jgi:MFS family permease
VQIYSPVLSSVAALPETLTVAPGAAIVGIVAGKTGHYRWAVWASWVLTTLGCGLLYVCDPFTSVPAWIFLNLPVGLGTGMAITALTLAIQAACKPELNGAAAAFNPFLRTFGQALGISISGVTLQNAFRRELGKIPGFSVEVAREYSREATAIVEVIHGMADGEERIALQWAYLRSLRVIWIVMIVLSGVGTLLSFGIRGYSLNQEHVSKQKLETEASVSTSGEIATGTRAEKS